MGSSHEHLWRTQVRQLIFLLHVVLNGTFIISFNKEMLCQSGNVAGTLDFKAYYNYYVLLFIAVVSLVT